MKSYGQENEFAFSISDAMGGFLILIGTGILIWVVTSLFQLFTDTSSFLVLDEIIPQTMVITEFSNGTILLPREVLIFGIPIWALSASSKIGLILLKGGLNFMQKPKKK